MDSSSVCILNVGSPNGNLLTDPADIVQNKIFSFADVIKLSRDISYIR